MSDDFRRMTDEEAHVAATHLRARELGATVAGNTEGADLLRRTARELEAARAGEARHLRLVRLLVAMLMDTGISREDGVICWCADRPSEACWDEPDGGSVFCRERRALLASVPP